MKRFYADLTKNGGKVEVTAPSGKTYIIKVDDVLYLTPKGDPVFEVYNGAELVGTISCRWNWDDFVKEFRL